MCFWKTESYFYNLGKENAIFANLTKAAERNGHFKVYNSETLPARWHVDNSRRMGPIVAVADIDYGFQDLIALAKFYEEMYNVTSEFERQHEL